MATSLTYFVSYSYASEAVSGFGNLLLDSDRLIASADDIRRIQGIIEKDKDFEGVIVLYFVRLVEG